MAPHAVNYSKNTVLSNRVKLRRKQFDKMIKTTSFLILTYKLYFLAITSKGIDSIDNLTINNRLIALFLKK